MTICNPFKPECWRNYKIYVPTNHQGASMTHLDIKSNPHFSDTVVFFQVFHLRTILFQQLFQQLISIVPHKKTWFVFSVTRGQNKDSRAKSPTKN